MFSVEASVPAKVKLLLAVRVLPSAIVRVDPVAGAVIATLFTDVAVATPNVGVVMVGEVSVLLVKVSVPSNVAIVPVVGRVTVPEPAVAFAFRIVVPLVEPAMISLPTLPAAPKVFAPVML